MNRRGHTVLTYLEVEEVVEAQDAVLVRWVRGVDVLQQPDLV